MSRPTVVEDEIVVPVLFGAWLYMSAIISGYDTVTYLMSWTGSCVVVVVVAYELGNRRLGNRCLLSFLASWAAPFVVVSTLMAHTPLYSVARYRLYV
jgi:Na+(H+)/acetate symporter ActP